MEAREHLREALTCLQIRVGRHPSAACMGLTLGSLRRPISPRLPGTSAMRPAPRLNSRKRRPRRSLPKTRRRSRLPIRSGRRTKWCAATARRRRQRGQRPIGCRGEKWPADFTRAGLGCVLYWARARLGVADGLARIPRSPARHTINQGARLSAPLFHGRLAELEADQMSLDEALTSIDRAIELARAGDIRYIDALAAPHPRRHPAPARSRRTPHPAEEAYLAAIAVAQRAGRAQLRPAGGAEAGEALPIHRPPRRSPRRPRAGARRVLADAGDARNRGRAGAARRAC